MANIALLRESHGRVIRIRRPLVILQVTTYAGRRRQVVVAILMAIRARQVRMRARQRESTL